MLRRRGKYLHQEIAADLLRRVERGSARIVDQALQQLAAFGSPVGLVTQVVPAHEQPSPCARPHFEDRSQLVVEVEIAHRLYDGPEGFGQLVEDEAMRPLRQRVPLPAEET